MTTVGYGDMYPQSIYGYIMTVIVMIVGLVITALPIAIVGGNFADVHAYNRKREGKLKDQKKSSNSEITETTAL